MTVLGEYPVGEVEPATMAALDLIALGQSSFSDAVLLIEISATDGALVSLGGDLILGEDPVGEMPGGIVGGDVALDYSDRDWTSRPGDTRANVHFEGRVRDVSLDRSIPLSPGAERRVAATVSEIPIDNTDGAQDGIEGRLAVDGRPVTVSLLGHRSAAYAERVTLLAGVGRAWRTDARLLRLTAVSQAYRLDVPMLGLYGGTGGADGGEDLKGKPIQEVWGLCRGAGLQLVDAARGIYLVSARQVEAILAVYVRGASVTPGTMRVSYAVLAATSATGGTWDWTIAPGGTFIRLGSNPDGTVTADVQGDAASGYVATLASMMRVILGRFGASVSAATFDSMAAVAPGVAGLVLAEQANVAEVLTRLASAGAMWWGDAGDGRIALGRLAAPDTDGGVLLDQEGILGEVEPMAPPATLWRVVATYRRNWTQLSGTDLVPVPTITADRRGELQGASRQTAVAAPQRTTRNALAEELTIETLFDEEADAQALAQNLLDLYAPGRSYLRVPTGLSGLGLQLGQQARVVWPRHGLATGRNVRVVGQSLRGRGVDLLVLG
ncbi:hypothetical protein [Roseococcus sp.]|uniref:hypothetical protein n=1 Tax=Roseococcus sp. TaxID=2109646 RepID=UPI003BAAEA5E